MVWLNVTTQSLASSWSIWHWFHLLLEGYCCIERWLYGYSAIYLSMKSNDSYHISYLLGPSMTNTPCSFHTSQHFPLRVILLWRRMHTFYLAPYNIFVSMHSSWVLSWSLVNSSSEFLWIWLRHTPDLYPFVNLVTKFGSTGLNLGEDMGKSSEGCKSFLQ